MWWNASVTSRDWTAVVGQFTLSYERINGRLGGVR
jgi:hypothetical protein